MRVLAQNRMLLRWGGIALICYGGLLFGVNSLRKPSGVTVVSAPAQSPSPVQPILSIPPQQTAPAVQRSTRKVFGSPGNVVAGQTIAPDRTGELIVINNSQRGFPILSLGHYTDFWAKSSDPTAHFHLRLTGAEYEEWFKTNRKVLLRAFGEPEDICKTPVLLGVMPKEAHTLTITITLGDAKKCLGLP